MPVLAFSCVFILEVDSKFHLCIMDSYHYLWLFNFFHQYQGYNPLLNCCCYGYDSTYVTSTSIFWWPHDNRKAC